MGCPAVGAVGPLLAVLLQVVVGCQGQNVGTRPRGQQAVLTCWVGYSSTNEILSLGILSIGHSADEGMLYGRLL